MVHGVDRNIGYVIKALEDNNLVSMSYDMSFLHR
jgi:hypothetical protein